MSQSSDATLETGLGVAAAFTLLAGLPIVAGASFCLSKAAAGKPPSSMNPMGNGAPPQP